MCENMTYTEYNTLEQQRREHLAAINNNAADRDELERRYGAVYDTAQLTDAFEVSNFLAPFVLCRRKSDGVRGSLEFQHSPRYYFNFQPATVQEPA